MMFKLETINWIIPVRTRPTVRLHRYMSDQYIAAVSTQYIPGMIVNLSGNITAGDWV